MLDQAEASTLIEQCIKASLNFWEIADDWDVAFNFLKHNEDDPEPEDGELVSAAECVIIENYKRVRITFDLDEIESPEKLWQIAVHEVCHIVTAEYRIFHKVLPTDEWTDQVWDFACERTTTQLERVFLREHPYAEVATP